MSQDNLYISLPRDLSMKTLRKEALFVVLLLSIISIHSVSAEILLSQTESMYNVGDEFSIDITITTQSFTSDFFTALLICSEGDEMELYRSPVSLQTGGQKELTIDTTLGNFLVSGRKGTCYIEGRYENFVAQSQEFEITDDIDVTLNVEGTAFDPSENVRVYGKATKANGQSLNGFVELTVEGLSTKHSTKVTNGDFSSNFSIPSNAKAGNYKVIARAYESDDGGELQNQGDALNAIRVTQVMKKIEIAFDKQSVSPADQIKYTILAFDQAGEEMKTESSLTIYRPDETVATKKLVKTQEPITFKPARNDTPGYWRAEVTAGSFNAEKTFLVEEYELIDFELVDDILTVKNVGNVPYDKPFEVTIGDTTEVKTLAEPLSLGATKQYKLVAPDGQYNIKVSDGSDAKELGIAPLTGRAVSVEDIGQSLSNNLTILLALIVILLIAITGLYIYRSISKHRSPKTAGVQPTNIEKQAMKSPHPQTQALNLIDQGQKQESEIIAIHIKNPESLQEGSAQAGALDSALWKASETGAKIYTEPDFRIIVFTEILTREKDNSLKAVSIAQTIDRILSEHNKRATAPLEYGIGVHNGNLIVEQKDGKFRFISTDNSILAAKRLGKEAFGEVYLSPSLHRKTIGKVKAEKVRDKEAWTIKRVVDRSLHSDYIRNFKNQMNKDPSSMPKTNETKKLPKS